MTFSIMFEGGWMKSVLKTATKPTVRTFTLADKRWISLKVTEMLHTIKGMPPFKVGYGNAPWATKVFLTDMPLNLYKGKRGQLLGPIDFGDRKKNDEAVIRVGTMSNLPIAILTSHEIGHALGFIHTNIIGDIMNADKIVVIDGKIVFINKTYPGVRP